MVPVAMHGGFGVFVKKADRTAAYLARHRLSYREWSAALLAVLEDGGLGVFYAQEAHTETWLALYLTLAGFIGDQGPDLSISAPETILAELSPADTGYPIAKATLEILPDFQQRVATMLMQLPGGDAYVAYARGPTPPLGHSDDKAP